jgi:hypothetical protein
MKQVKKRDFAFEQVLVYDDAGEDGGVSSIVLALFVGFAVGPEWCVGEKSGFFFFFFFFFFTRPGRRVKAGWCCFTRLWRSFILMGTLKGSSSVLKELRQKDMMNNPSGSGAW